MAADLPPARIVSLLPAATEVLVALGARDELVARTTSDLRASGLSDVGDPLAPSLERISAASPDLVIARPNADLAALRRAVPGAEVEPLAIDGLDDLRSAIERLGRLVHREDRAAEIRARLDAALDRARRIGRAGGGPVVAWVVWPQPPTLAGPGSFLDEVLTLAGGVNVLAEGEGTWPAVGLETLITRDPDVLVWSGGGSAPGLDAAPGSWGSLRAVREGRVLVVHPNAYHVPGPSIAESAVDLAVRLRAFGTVPRGRAGAR